MSAFKPVILRPAAYGLLFDHDQLLVVRLGPNEKDCGKWTLPGGGLHRGESPEQGVVREVAEETGQDVKIIKKLGFRDVVYENATGFLHAQQHLFWVERLGGELRPESNGDTDALDWLSLADPTALPVVDLVHWAIPFAKVATMRLF